jgi:xylose isomerase
MRTSLGIWAFGPMVTRFVPGGYQPQLAGQSTADKVRRAVEGLGDLIDGYEFHYPQELSSDNLDAVRDSLDGHDI